MNCTSVTRQSVVVCRLCSKSDEYYVNIFISNESCEMIVEEAIQDVLGLPVAVGDGLPNVVCRLCLRKLIEFREFKNMCFKSATELRAYALGNDFLVSKTRDEDAADVEISREGSSQEIKFLNDIHVTQVYLTTPDEFAIGTVSHVKDELRSTENALVVKEEVNDDEHCIEGYVPMNTLTSVAVDPLAVDTMSLKEETQEQKGDAGEGSSLGDLSPHNHIQVTEVFVPVPDQLAMGTVCHVEEDSRSAELMDKEEIGEGLDCCENDVPVGSLSSVKVDPLAVDTTVDCSYYIGGIPGVPEVYLDKFVSGRQENSQPRLASNSSYDHMHEENLQFECSPANYLLAHCHSGKIPKGMENLNLCDISKMSSSSNYLKELKCDTCGKNFRYSCDLKKHSVTHTGVKPYRCDMCGKNFTDKSNLKRHTIIHTGVKPFKCDVCGKGFTERSDIKRHLLIHTGVKPYKCAVCGKTFTQSGTLKSHLVVHTGVKPFKCDVCGKMFTRSCNLAAHLVVHTGEKTFKCNICGKSYSVKSNLKKHSIKHTAVKPYQCTVCGKMFTQRDSLKSHSVVHTGVKTFKCDVCGKMFTRSGNLAAHSVIHSGEKKFKCNICGKNFSIKSSLKKHSVVHTGVKTYKCTVCGKMFSQSGSLKKHSILHSGLKPFKCDVCGKMFTRSGNLASHMVIHSGE